MYIDNEAYCGLPTDNTPGSLQRRLQEQEVRSVFSILDGDVDQYAGCTFQKLCEVISC